MLALLALGAACGSPEPETSPNVLFYVVDTLRADELGAYGNPVVQTPALDRFADEGTLFERVYAPSSWTRTSVASILTGMEPDVHGVEERDDALSPDLTLLPEVLAEHGYTTAAMVANPNIGSFFGFDRGFGTFVELYWRGHAGRVGSSELITGSSELTDRAAAWLADAPRPFFLFVFSIDPHWPYDPPARFDRYGGDYAGSVEDGGPSVLRDDLDAADRARVRSLYDGEVSENDESFGRLLDRLRALGLDDDTLVVFTSDHGEEFWDHGGRWHGTTLFEESVRVPLVVRGPGVAAGRRSAPAVGLVDLAPSVLERLGLPIPDGLQGRPVLGGRPTHGSRALFARLNLDGHSLRAVVQPPWKLVRDLQSGRQLLFQLERDPAERASEDDARARRVAAMDTLLIERAAANHALRSRLLAGHEERRKVDEADLPEEDRNALEALGYLDR